MSEIINIMSETVNIKPESVEMLMTGVCLTKCPGGLLAVMAKIA